MDSIITRDNCDKVLARHLKDLKYVFEEFQVESLAGKVPGMMAEYYTLTIQAKVNDEVEKKQYFVKRMAMFHKIQEIMGREQGAYEKEDYIYNYLIPEFNKITNSTATYAPECYLALKNNLFVLQDMSELGYKTIAVSHDLDHCKAALKTIAEFHASSIIFEEKQTALTGKQFSLLKETPDIFKDSLYRQDDDYLGRQWFKNCLHTLLKISTINFASEEFTVRMMKFESKFYTILQASKKYRNVVCHGDLSLGNVLFRESDDGISCKLVDFQALRYTPPAHDVLSYIYLVTEQTFRAKHTEELLKQYHDCLHKALAEHEIKINFSYSEFVDSIEYVRGTVLLQTAFYATMIPLAEYPHIEKDQELYKKYVYGDRSPQCLEQYRKGGRFAKITDEILVELLFVLDN